MLSPPLSINSPHRVSRASRRQDSAGESVKHKRVSYLMSDTSPPPAGTVQGNRYAPPRIYCEAMSAHQNHRDSKKEDILANDRITDKRSSKASCRSRKPSSVSERRYNTYGHEAQPGSQLTLIPPNRGSLERRPRKYVS